MNPEDQERVFEPFFSTKKEGAGTGLGLATVYGIVKQHDGMINLYSEPGRGTLVKVYMPSVQRAAAEVGAPLQGPARGGNELLLVAEDDPSLRHLMARIREGAGYQVISAASGSEAVALFGGIEIRPGRPFWPVAPAEER